MTATILDLANVISITIQSAPSLLSAPNINTIGFITQDQPSGWDPDEAFRKYDSLQDVGTDFGTGSNTYQIAAGFFAQAQNPLGSGGYLAIIPRLTSPSLESILAAIQRTINLVYYVGVIIDQELDGTTFAALALAIQAMDKMLFYASSQQSDFAPGGMLDLVRQAGETHTRCLYYNDGVALDTQIMASAYAARGMSTNFAGSNTTSTMNLKTLAGLVADTTLNQTDVDAAKAAGVDVYVNIGGVVSTLTSGENGWFDEVYNELWFKLALQVAGFNFLRASSTKVPQTELGMDGLKNAYRGVCQQAVVNGYLAPGSWTSPDVFGDPDSLRRSVAGIGFYIYSLPVALQSQADREDRIAPLVQIAVKAAGAIHKSNVIVEVNL